MNWPELVVVLAAALLSCAAVPIAYVVWLRLAGLEPTATRRFASLPTWVRTIAAALVGLGIATSLQVVPSLVAGIALVTLVASSTLAGLVLFESVSAARR